jgi:hypothetical protein
MKSGCLKSVLMLLVFGAAWYTLFHLWFPPLDAILGSLVCGFGSVMIVEAFHATFKSWSDARRVSDTSSAGDMRPGAGRLEDGKLVTVVGRIRATGPTLRAPLSQRPCVLYEYDVSKTYQSRGDDQERKAFSGFALTPSVIEAPNLSVKLLGFPELQGFDQETLEGSVHFENGRNYIQATAFEDMQGMAAIGKVWGLVKERIADDDGAVRKDWQMADKSYDISDSSLTERIVAPGDQVCAIGVYSAAKGGIVSDLSKGLNKLLKGDARTSASSLRTQGIGQLFAGTFFGLFMIGITCAIAMARNPEPATHQLLALLHSVRPGPPIVRKTLAPGDPEVVACNQWLYNVQVEDRTRLYKLSARHIRSWFDDLPFAEWKAARPAKASLVQGTSVGDKAVLVMRGKRPDGVMVDGNFELHRSDGVWQIQDETWTQANSVPPSPTQSRGAATST